MAFLLALVLFAPAAIYFVITYFVFQFQVGFFFVMALLGMFVIGMAAYEYLQAKFWQYQTRFPSVAFILGSVVTSIATMFLVRQRAEDAPIKEQIAMTAVIRLVMVGFLILCYVLAKMQIDRPKAHKRMHVLFGSLCFCLTTLIILSCWLPGFSFVYQCAFSAVAMMISGLNVVTVIGSNLHYHGKPFVLYRKIDSWEKSSSALGDILFIALPILFAVAQWL